MKKKIFLLPLFALIMSGCSPSTSNSSNSENENNNSQEHGSSESGSGGGNEQGGGGSSEGGGSDTTVHVASVSLNKSSTSIVEDNSETLTCTVLPENATNKAITWSTSNSNVASVSNGVVRGLNAGTATITVASVDGNKTATCAVTVTEKQAPEVHVTSVSLNKNQLSLEETQSETLTCTVLPTDATNNEVTWSISDPLVASVTDGIVYANNPGTATITVASVDGNKTATCTLTVTAKVPEVKTISSTLDFTEKYYSKSDKEITEFTYEQEINENVTVTFSKGEASTNVPKCYAYNKVTAVRVYAGNDFTISSQENINKVELTYQSAKDNPSLEVASDPEGFSVDTWTGSSKEIKFTTDKSGSGYRAITTIKVTYEGEAETEVELNLGVKTIAEVKQYIATNPVKKNAFGNGVNEYRIVTIKGFALAKINLEKAKAAYGLDVSEFGKVIMADSTGYIGVASKVSGDGTTLYGKVGSYACTDTARYVVTGYLSEYLGHPEILVTSFTWDKNLNVTWSPSVISEATVDIEGFYSRAANTYYNCAGHAYGEVLTLNNLKLYYSESDGQGKRYYNFTDGVKNIRVNAFNLTSISEGKNYDITGIISIKNLSPIIVAFEMKQSEDQTEIAFNYDKESVAQDITIANLKQIHGSQDDVDTRTVKFPEVINAYGQIFKTTGYLTAVEEGGKYYIGISDSYIERKELINGKDNAMANYGISLIKNQNFWDTDESELYKFNPLFDEYVLEDNPITVYYIVRQQRYQSGKPMWEILLLPDFLNSLQAE